MLTWKRDVKTIMPMKRLLLKKSLNTLTFSISLELISLNTWTPRDKNEQEE